MNCLILRGAVAVLEVPVNSYHLRGYIYGLICLASFVAGMYYEDATRMVVSLALLPLCFLMATRRF